MCVNLKPCYVNHHSRFISSTPIITSGTTLCYTDKSECLIYSQESWTFSPPKINPIGSPLSIVTFTAFMIRKKYFIVKQQARIQIFLHLRKMRQFIRHYWSSKSQNLLLIWLFLFSDLLSSEIIVNLLILKWQEDIFHHPLGMQPWNGRSTTCQFHRLCGDSREP